ncbi:SAM-dependent methyltransferase [Actinophytocola sp.]|jgi:O-methyltransferase involved in polyketide biosynthesis|uniref:SAM-dependent methyltransferase n=1 Tax=Actinophytocola sp. TaxID=1872138 RepID=UPI002D348A2B|nr:SAM-dependent methyltransferase [Actinophytocola sp.]HYQ67945.1 SAM-dependent methyltransferase [Actinophytocola sp.]
MDAMRSLEGSLDRPSAARVYDYFLGGTRNYAIDRVFADKVRAALPIIAPAARTCRQFLGRAVHHCVDAGIRQFVDLGSGLPTEGNVHEVADTASGAGDTRVVYVDNEPVALAHSQILLAETADPTRHHAIAGDLLRPRELWKEIRKTGLVTPDEPVGLVINAVLHFIDDDQDPAGALDYYRAQLPPGSMLVLSHITTQNPVDDAEREAMDYVAAQYESTTNPGLSRTAAQFARFFGDWPLEEPGVVYAPAWHPDDRTLFADDPPRTHVLAGVARKTAA